MDCVELQEDLSAYVDNELTPEERARVEAHTSTCSQCAEELAAYRAVKSLVARVRLYQEDVPETLRVVPPVVESPIFSADRLSWLHRPVRARSVMVAAAAVVVALLLGWREYETRFVRSVIQREAVMAHLHGVTEVLPVQPDALVKASLKPVDDRVYARPQGVTSIGHLVAFHTMFYVGPHVISQLRFAGGGFADQSLQKQIVGGREYRVGRVGNYSMASYKRGSVQIVLVSDISPEALLLLAQNLPPDTPFIPSGTGY